MTLYIFLKDISVICFILNMPCICYGNFMVLCHMTIGLNEDYVRYLGELKFSGASKSNCLALHNSISVVSINWTTSVVRAPED